MSLADDMHDLGRKAREASRVLLQTPTAQKDRALLAAAAAIRARADSILAANRRDMEEASAADLSEALLDRLLLNPARVEAMAKGVETVARLPDPVGHRLDAWDVAANGLHIEKLAVPLGVIAVIYESRPNVTADAGALCLKSGNAAILRGGSESFHSSQAILHALHEGLRDAGLPEDAIQLVPTTDREAVGLLLGMTEFVDVVVPRGGVSLNERVRQESRVPTLLHLAGNCHTYIHAAADATTAVAVTHNAKLRRTGVCGATESILIDRAVLKTIGAAVVKDLLDNGCELRGDAEVQKLDARIKQAHEEDWSTEYLASIVSVKMVGGIDEALAHIARYGSHHTDAIITEDKDAAQRFTAAVDSAIVLVNASTQFADGGEFGFGAEIGIATGRLHARGPVGLKQLVTYKYVLTTARDGGAIRAG
ncbi:MAG: glutamate-5-semialdehyde dehydrogenase [Alphaproteobacteria bacterium]